MDTSIQQALKPGTRIASFEIEAVLGVGGFGITYKAWDHDLACEVAIKEYLPANLATRGPDHNAVTVLTGNEDTTTTYASGLNKFLDEARTLAKFRDPYLVGVKQFLKANGTAYMVMDYENGESLAQYIKRNSPPRPGAELDALLRRLLRGLETLHGHGILHRDIKPSNIFIREDGSPVLLDFGSARERRERNAGREYTTMVTHGYAPHEQYHKRGNQGPWTDLYALGATLYYCLTGGKPTGGMERYMALQEGSPDPLQPAAAVGQESAPPRLLAAIDWMLRVPVEERPQNARAVLEVVEDEAPVPFALGAGYAEGGDDDTAFSHYHRLPPTPVARLWARLGKRLSAWHPSTWTRRQIIWGAAGVGVTAILVATPLWVSAKIDRDLAAAISTAGRAGLGVDVYVNTVSAPMFGKQIRLTGVRVANPADYQSSYLLTAKTVDIQVHRRLWWLRNEFHATNVSVSEPHLTYEPGERHKPSNLEAFVAKLQRRELALRGQEKHRHRLLIDRLTVAPGEIRVVTKPESDVVVTKSVGKLILVDVGADSALYPADVLNAVLGRLGQTAQVAIKNSQVIRRATGREPEVQQRAAVKSRHEPARRNTTMWDSIKRWFSEAPGKVFNNSGHQASENP